MLSNLETVLAVEEVQPQETVEAETYNEQFSALISQNDALISQQSEMSGTIANIDSISQYSFVILLVALVAAVISKTFFSGGY